MANPILVEVSRGDRLESVHRGAVSVVDGDGKVVWQTGDTQWPVFPRSAVKAIQALGAKHEGTLRNYARFADGTWVDIAILSMMREEAKMAVKNIESSLSLTQA